MADLEFRAVSKKYTIEDPDAVPGAGRGRLAKALRRWKPKSDFWAVRDVDFQVEHGEALGIIGPNGAGKSTILKLLSNVTTPTMGEIRIRGRIAALLEVGSGFHPELTGQENVYLSGSILGMRRGEISKKLDSILDFAGVRMFADTPVKRYSSGMYVRLGFSIAAHLDADILLLDEVLAVGDVKFQQRCLERILDLRSNGRTIVFISHDLAAVRHLCNRVLLLDHGRVVAEGTPEAAIRHYAVLGRELTPRASNAMTELHKAAKITAFSFFDEAGMPTTELRSGYPVRAVVEYDARHEVSPATVNVLIYLAGEWVVVTHFSTAEGARPLTLRPGGGAIEFTCDELTLPVGAYSAACTIEDEYHELDVAADVHFTVGPGKFVRGKFYTSHTWRELPVAPAALAHFERPPAESEPK